MQRQQCECLYLRDCQRVEGGTDEKECTGGWGSKRGEGQTDRGAGICGNSNPNEVFLM